MYERHKRLYDDEKRSIRIEIDREKSVGGALMQNDVSSIEIFNFFANNLKLYFREFFTR